MKRRVDVWPALSDLFAGLLVATFGGLMLFTGSGPADPAEEEARRIREGVVATLRESLGGNVRSQGGDVHLDVSLNFDTDSHAVLGRDRQKLRQACGDLRQILAQHKNWRSEVEIWIEGHTDNRRPDSGSHRERYLHNWKLSAERANSVLYEFSRCGIAPPLNRIRAIGYADSKPVIKCSGDCPQNRRTTFRIHPDKCVIEARLNRTDPAGCAAP
jgi:flagellar motor protein MotB